jgi:hypothetical protein
MTYLGKFSTIKTWFSIRMYQDGKAELKTWFPGCKFSPSNRMFPNVLTAKEYAEKAMETFYKGVE